LDHKNHCAALFIELSKDFDTVDHHTLIQRLTEIGLNQASCKWFENDLSDRVQCVICDGVMSRFLDIRKGVPQGSLPRSVLFTISIHNIGLFVQTCNIHLYADDPVMYAIAPTVDQVLLELQSDFGALQNALFFLKVGLNVGNTKYMFFSNSHTFFLQWTIYLLIERFSH
jgi:hypothetical protein